MWNVLYIKLSQAIQEKITQLIEALKCKVTHRINNRELFEQTPDCLSAHFTLCAPGQHVRGNSYPFFKGHHILRSKEQSPSKHCSLLCSMLTCSAKSTEERDYRGKVNKGKEIKYVTIGKILLWVLKILGWKIIL